MDGSWQTAWERRVSGSRAPAAKDGWLRRARGWAVAGLAGAAVAATLGAAPAHVVTLEGRRAEDYRARKLAPGTVIDARRAVFLASLENKYPISLGGGPDGCIAGGTVLGQYDRTRSWDWMHDRNNAGLAFENARFTVDGIRIDNVTDGIRPRPGGAFTIRNAWLSFIRDDCLENDHLEGGLVADSLLDGCYVAFSTRPSSSKIESGHDGSRKTLEVRDSLVRLLPMPGPRGESPDGRGHGGFFKWHKWKDPAGSLSPKLALHGNVFMAERVGQGGDERMGLPPGQLESCSNNVMVWLGPGDYPASLPTCFRVVKDRRVWDDAVAAWLARHHYDPAGTRTVAPERVAACGLPGPRESVSSRYRDPRRRAPGGLGARPQGSVPSLGPVS
jgi:hypothetical protein